MADSGPFLTSCIIFYLSIGAAIFQILEEPNWKSARDQYILAKENILKNYACLTKESLDEILEVVSEAAGQGVTITGEIHRNSWDWANSVIFASTIVTTIGFGNVAPKTQGGRVFCILYGLCGIPLCLVWISQLGSFFGDRAKRLSGILIRKGVSVKNVQYTCTGLFLLWGLLVHLVIPPFVFMSVEGWSYLEGLYYSFITLTTVGFGDYVAGVNPNIDYPRLYRVFSELWIYMGLAWLSLFFSWNVNMVVEAHKVLKKKRRLRHQRHFFDEDSPSFEDKPDPTVKLTTIDIFNFPKDEDYSTVIKEIGATAKTISPPQNINRSKSCSDILAVNIRTLDHSPQHKRFLCISDVFVNPNANEDQAAPSVEDKPDPTVKPTTIDIFNFPKDGDCSTLVKEIGATAKTISPPQNINRSKSCSENIQTLDHSPKHKRFLCISDVFVNPNANKDKDEQNEGPTVLQESNGGPDPASDTRKDKDENKDNCSFDSEMKGIIFTVPKRDAAEEESLQHPNGGGTRFTISKVEEKHLLMDKDEKGDF